MRCPACQKDETLQTADGLVCKCGYAFMGPQTNSLIVLAAIERALRSIKSILLFWVWLTVIVTVVEVVRFMIAHSY
jgi:hypothetical protein